MPIKYIHTNILIYTHTCCACSADAHYAFFFQKKVHLLSFHENPVFGRPRSVNFEVGSEKITNQDDRLTCRYSKSHAHRNVSNNIFIVY